MCLLRRSTAAGSRVRAEGCKHMSLVFQEESLGRAWRFSFFWLVYVSCVGNLPLEGAWGPLSIAELIVLSCPAAGSHCRVLVVQRTAFGLHLKHTVLTAQIAAV